MAINDAMPPEAAHVVTYFKFHINLLLPLLQLTVIFSL